MIARSVLALALLAVAVYGLFEIRRWRTPVTQELIGPRQRRNRGWGLALLLLTLTLFLVGTFLPRPHTKLQALHALIYWTATTLCALPLIPLALLDARENLHRLMEGRQELAQQRHAFSLDLPPPAENSHKPPVAPEDS